MGVRVFCLPGEPTLVRKRTGEVKPRSTLVPCMFPVWCKCAGYDRLRCWAEDRDMPVCKPSLQLPAYTTPTGSPQPPVTTALLLGRVLALHSAVVAWSDPSCTGGQRMVTVAAHELLAQFLGLWESAPETVGEACTMDAMASLRDLVWLTHAFVDRDVSDSKYPMGFAGRPLVTPEGLDPFENGPTLLPEEGMDEADLWEGVGFNTDILRPSIPTTVRAFCVLLHQVVPLAQHLRDTDGGRRPVFCLLVVLLDAIGHLFGGSLLLTSGPLAASLAIAVSLTVTDLVEHVSAGGLAAGGGGSAADARDSLQMYGVSRVWVEAGRAMWAVLRVPYVIGRSKRVFLYPGLELFPSEETAVLVGDAVNALVTMQGKHVRTTPHRLKELHGHYGARFGQPYFVTFDSVAKLLTGAGP